MKKLRDKYFSYYKEGNFLRYKQFFLERDILRIAYYIFETEKKIKQGEKVTKVIIPLSESTYKNKNLNALRSVLEELLLLILCEDIQIDFKEINDLKRRINRDYPVEKVDAICLFSGGVDSYAGITLAEKKYQKIIGVFVAHNDQVRIIKIINEFKGKIKTPIKTIYAPSMESEGYSQFRGFLYILSGGVYANLADTNKILVTECGPTMYQPLFSPYDSITYTTHPYVLKSAKDVLEILLEKETEIIIPFENLTKAEVIANSHMDDFSKTHSCITQRRGDHCGTCFGCVIKKLAENVAGVKGVRYNKNIFEEGTNRDNIFNILKFSEDIILDKDKMPGFQKEKINEFNKWNLFNRYALDNLSGLMLSTEQNNDLFKRFISKDIEPLLTKRIQEVRENKYKPNFNKKVE
jgi:7-cyano-7-deazaguanine synthase in queuosine biosynthesis